ncbi:putative zinc finger CCHC domain-containing protein 3-like [Apostichopus japonicus]|uniref:Putative zinc finger CCHC domain-containing protein 3-like n=1 Tax=Stichopus japonicus TaxID=307972 RepID=A0A2G8JXD9_STIJA|nr:putative zinc finger CCHC domain-containing protein 3-like [Apostichopus japonicus]
MGFVPRFLTREGGAPGCPLSPLLYVLFSESLSRLLERDSKLVPFVVPGGAKVKCAQYADDVTCIVSSLGSFRALSQDLSIFERATGAKLNPEKTKGLRLGSWRYRDLPFGASWSDQNIKINGIWFGYDAPCDVTWNERAEFVFVTPLWHSHLRYHGIARRDSKIVKLTFTGEQAVPPVQVFSILKSKGVVVPGEVDALQALQGRNTYDLRFTSDVARQKGVTLLSNVEGMTVTPYERSVWVTIIHVGLEVRQELVVTVLGRFGAVKAAKMCSYAQAPGVLNGHRQVRIDLKQDIPSFLL